MSSRRARAAAALFGLALLASVSCTRTVGRGPPGSGGPAAGPGGEVTPPPGIALETTCVTTGPELCFDAIDNNCNGLLEEGCGVNSGLVQVAAAWSEAEADVDLLVTDPNGELAKPGSLTGAGLTKDRDCPGSDRACHGQNMENVYLEADTDPAKGVYKVVVRLEKTGGAPLPIKVHIGARIGPRIYGLSVELGAQEEEKAFSFRL